MYSADAALDLPTRPVSRAQYLPLCIAPSNHRLYHAVERRRVLPYRGRFKEIDREILVIILRPEITAWSLDLGYLW